RRTRRRDGLEAHDNLPSVYARCPRRSGRKSGYVRRQFFGGLSPLRGPSASVVADKQPSGIGRHKTSLAAAPFASSQPPALVDVTLCAHLADLDGNAVAAVRRGG